MIKDSKSDEMYSEKQRSDREIIDMVTMAGITFEDEDDMIYTQNNSKDISKVFGVYCKYTLENNRLTIVTKNSYDVVVLNSTSLVLATTKESDGKKITTTNIFKLRERKIY